MDEILTPAFLTGFFTIIGIDVILSGDNAVVIALAARSLPPHQQKPAVVWGHGAGRGGVMGQVYSRFGGPRAGLFAGRCQRR